MPRYDDRYGSNDRHSSTRLYVGHLSSRTRERDLERLFSKYGRIRDLDMKRDYAFIDFSDPRDADDARYRLDGRDFDGSRIIVEFAKGTPRGSREISSSRGPPPGTGVAKVTQDLRFALGLGLGLLVAEEEALAEAEAEATAVASLEITGYEGKGSES
ncbi:unnamed protein product [Thlaspi arvense]|uniref:RRM domain-containing protein n=1 Tax=Thlaspi arvense TaxID=13288 RepID=A0AAU9RY46_THLAR|nr:unnamed protein product [Thlaspi arvense]